MWVVPRGPGVLAWTVLPVAAAVVYVSAFRARRLKGEPPLEPGWIPFVGLGFEFIRDFSGLMARLRAKHGDVFTIINFGQRMTFVTNMAAIGRIWVASHDFDFVEFGIGADARLAGLNRVDVAASGVGTATLALHAKEMRMPERLEILGARFRAALEDLCAVPMFSAAIPNGASDWLTCELMDFSGMLIWFAAGRSLFGRCWCADVDVRESYKAYETFSGQAPLMAGGLPSFLTRKGDTARDAIVHNVVMPAVEAVLKAWKDGADKTEDGPGNPHPYLANYIVALAQAYPQNTEAIARRLMGILFAVMTNTMMLVFWAIARLYTIPAEERKAIRQEIDAQPTESMGSYADMKQSLPLFNSFLLETLRLHSDPNSFRVVKNSCSVSGLGDFREGDHVFLLSSVDQMAVNKYVADPACFKTDRWRLHTSSAELKDKLLQLPPEQVLIPFGGGKHLCPGRHFSMLEMHFGISWVIAHFDFELPPSNKGLPAKVVELAAPINVPKAPFPIRYRRRVA
eukprot:TRINITY_DN38257_c0_g1_i1.p1 TRINITY_DN38257_c0_g1~~TRINITY_DN38257_c0_g1_i1.p1  ORF type:complete len:513 (+),score=65.58 TRINITY_DN38257_c0_g1_i1:58-1596(+)